MNTSIKIATVSALVLSAGSAFATPVDLTSWIAEGPGSWNVASPADSVLQTINGQPTVFHNNTDSQGNALAGSIEVQTSGDDDFIGFVLGYDSGELGLSTADYWLIDWKQADQYYQGSGPRGLALSHVMGTGPEVDFWTHTGAVSEVARGTNLGSVGWADNTEYLFDLTFTSTLIEVFVNDILEISYSGNFGDGGFGFYNYSQSDVRYAGISQTIIPPSPVPLPAGLPILFTALGALGFASRKRRKA